MRTSKGRHGGNRGKTDKGDALDDRQQAARNTDVDSMRRNRSANRAGGRDRGRS